MALHSVSVLDLAGETLTELNAVDVNDVSGLGLKGMIANACGFPSASMQLLSKKGFELKDSSLLKEAFDDHDAQYASSLTISCSMKASGPFGQKWCRERARGAFGRKGAMLLVERISRMERKAPNSTLQLLRTPVPAMRDEVKKLIVSSFAPGLEGFIDCALSAAFRQGHLADGRSAEEVAETAKTSFLYEDAQRGAYADLSFCQLWTTVIQAGTREGQEYARHANLVVNETGCPVVTAVLWRLLHGWTGSAKIAPLLPEVQAGAVLEVLFLATGSLFRNQEFALKLVAELEAAAKALGCAAVAVAAVPGQGVSFWKRCGYEVAVPLKGQPTPTAATANGFRFEDESLDADGPGLGEPVSELGHFLLEHMVLFTDTPLVAKLLVADRPQDKQES